MDPGPAPTSRAVFITLLLVALKIAVLFTLSVIGIVRADQLARDANEDAARRSTTTTSTTTATTSATAEGPSTTTSPATTTTPTTVETTTPGEVRTTSVILLVLTLVEAGALVLFARRNNRARIALIVLMALSVIEIPLGLFFALGGIYLLQFNRQVRAWTAPPEPA
jgi:magnesium-transporting ATPase (P-type)